MSLVDRGRGRFDYGRGKGDVMMEAHNMEECTLKMEKGATESRNMGSLQELRKAGKWILPLSLQKEASLANTLTLAQRTDFRVLTFRTLRVYELF